MAEGMTSRERVRAALEHREADRVPVDFGGMRSTGISAIAYNRLKARLGLGGHTRVYDIFQQLAEPEEDVLRIMGGDVVQLHRYEPAFGIDLQSWRDDVLPDGSPCLVPAGFLPATNADGSREIRDGNTVIARMPSGGYYFDLVHHPYAGAESTADIDAVPNEEMSETEREYLERRARELHAGTDRAILGSFGGNILEAGQSDFGYERFFMMLALEPDLVRYYLERKTSAYMRDLEKYLSAVGDYIDVIQFGDDLGTQVSSQISVDMYREMIKPYHARQFRWVRDHYPRVKVFLHSCGAIFDLIPDLIDAGVEILNPVQISARGMDPVRLKREFGEELTFWGGGVDTQSTVTNGSIGDIRNSVKELMRIFAPGGGFVFTQVHNLQANIDPEKILAIYEASREFGEYGKA